MSDRSARSKPAKTQAKPSRGTRAVKPAPKKGATGARATRPAAKAPRAPVRPTYDAETVKHMAREVAHWKAEDLAHITKKAPLRRKEFVTDSGIPIPDLLTLADRKYEADEQLGLPGRFPFTRGVQPTVYRGRLWTMRMFAG
ncbi:MAG: methylmalonyl-CoA mutase family protein, partial [Myxococcaceae bacterium]|nr:methylmalonyl-CoA mutase family protein [Myxococcaceae bacterium]